MLLQRCNTHTCLHRVCVVCVCAGVLTCVWPEADIVIYFLIPSPHFIFLKKIFTCICVHVYTMFREGAMCLWRLQEDTRYPGEELSSSPSRHAE